MTGGVIESEAWRTVAVPDQVTQVPTMLTPDEIRLLYVLARDGGHQHMADAGCFLGGSTVALAAGLRDAGGTGHVDAYDRFTADDYAASHVLDGIAEGESIRHLFDAHTAGLEDLVTAHEGDITTQPFPDRIDLAHIDVMKTWQVNDTVLAGLLPRLEPGALVIQQDWSSGLLPWIAVTMEHLAGALEPIVDVETTRVYRLTRPVTAEDLRFTRFDLAPDQMVALMDQAIAGVDGARRGRLLVAKAQLLLRVVGRRPGLALLDEIERDHADDPQVVGLARDLRGFDGSATDGLYFRLLRTGWLMRRRR